MKQEKLFDVLVWIITFIIILSVFFLPNQIPTHWNIDWQVDRYGSRYEFLVIGILPCLIYYMMNLLYKIDPWHNKMKQREKTFEFIKKGFFIFHSLLVIFFYSMILKPYADGTFVIGVLLGLFYIVLGNYMPKIPQNHFLGIKTPWTLKNEYVWKKTHRMGGYLFIVEGMIWLFTSFFDARQFCLITIITVIVFVIILLVYSYTLYKNIDIENN